MYFRSKCSMCSLARMRNEAILEFLGSLSSTRPNPPNKWWIAVVTCAEGAPASVCADVSRWVYDEPEVEAVGEDVMEDTTLRLLPGNGVVIHGSRGSEVLAPLLDSDEIEDNGKLSDSLNPAFSSFSWRRHLALLFWNQTCQTEKNYLCDFIIQNEFQGFKIFHQCFI